MSLRAGPLVQEQPPLCHVPLPEQHPFERSSAAQQATVRQRRAGPRGPEPSGEC
jgi:hypothetical protein